MRTAFLIAVLTALAASAALAAPSADKHPTGLHPAVEHPAVEHPAVEHHAGQHPAAARHRRFILFGWDMGRFLADVNRQVHRAWLASTLWAHRLLHWTHHRLPHHETVYDVVLPGGGAGVVRIVEFGAGHRGARGPLVWDGKRLAWQHADGDDADLLITLDHNGKHHAVKLAALARYLRQVPAGSKVRAQVLGSAWRDLRIVLHVIGEHGKEDATKSVSVLVSELIAKHGEKSHVSSHSHGSSLSQKSSHNHESSHSKTSGNHESSHSKESRSHESSNKKEEHESSKHNLAVALESHSKKGHATTSRRSEGSQTAASASKKKSSSSLVWDGQSLAWEDGAGDSKHAKKVNRRLRVTQDGVSHVIPLSLIAHHLGDVAAGSKISLQVVGKKLKDLQIVLRVQGAHGAAARTITLQAVDLIKEADVLRSVAQPPGKTTKHGKSLPLLGSHLFSTTTPPPSG